MRAGRRRNLFSIAPGVPFLRTLVGALCDGDLVPGFRYSADHPLALASVTIFVPTRRAARSLRSEFVDRIGTGSAILPSIRPLGETDDDEDLFDGEGETLDLDPPVSGVAATLEFANLVLKWKEQLPDAVRGFHAGAPLLAPASPADAVWLARGLADLLDAMETHDCRWADLDRLEAADYAEWWQLTLEFLKIARDFWPARLAELRRSSPAASRNARLLVQAARLKSKPPAGPVIVAGSTGSVPATAALMATIAELQQGALVLPGLDLTMDDAVWPLVAPTDPAGRIDPAALTHAQYGLSRLLDRLDASRGEIVDLGRVDPVLSRRNRLVSDALLPAAATDRWQQESRPCEEILSAFQAVSLIEAGSEREEAAAIAVAMRLAGEDQAARVALVTPDRNLARRVAVELHRFGIEANDSGGIPLAATPQAQLLTLLLDAVMQPGDPVALTALLDHPLARFSLDAATARRAAHALELLALRGTIGEVDVAALTALLEETARHDGAARHVPQWRRRIAAEDRALARRLAENVERLVAPLAGRFVRFSDDGGGRLTERMPLSEWAAETVAVLEAIAEDAEEGLSALWGDEAGEKLAAVLAEVMESAATLSATGAQWADIVAALIAGETVKPRTTAHPRIFIWGTLEARLQDVDTVVLAGLNEGSWPSQTANDPFLSRAMKMALGMEPAERRIGLAAHDFQMAMGIPRVVLSRSTRADKVPTIAARWLQRLEVITGEEAAKAMRARGARLLAAAARLDDGPARALAARPEPRPPREAQPKRYSFSEVRTLRRDPYAIYARRVLRLDPLTELIRDPGVAERGTLYHAVLEQFGREFAEGIGERAAERLAVIADEHFAAERLPHHIEVLWRPRLDHVARLVLDWERARDERIVRRHTELRAEWTIPATDLMLSGYADRIDIRTDGDAEILDFKSGTGPSRKLARILLDPQLALEAAALRAGAFERVGARRPVSLEYVRLKAADVLKVDRIDGHDKANVKEDGTYRSPEDLAENAVGELVRFVELLASGRRGFVSRLIPASARDFGGEYDHLARVAEWSSADGDEPQEGSDA